MPETELRPFIHAFIKDKKYFSNRAITAEAAKRKQKHAPTTINQYLYNLKIQGKVFDAGRGWYSTVPQPFEKDTGPVQMLAKQIRAKFPFLTFACWSTEQLQAHTHHLMALFTRFVYADADSMSSLTDFLKGIGYDAHLNPRKGEVKKYFTPSSTTVMVRPSVSEEPVDGDYATVEKILIDLFVEKDKLNLMDGAEYKRIFRNLVLANRIKMARLLRYADRRKVKESFVANVLKESADAICI